MTEFLVGTAEVLGALAVIVGAVTGLSRLRAARWLWRQLVAKPGSRWFRREVTEVVEPIVEAKLEPIRRELEANGGTSLKDVAVDTRERVNHIEARLAEG